MLLDRNALHSQSTPPASRWRTARGSSDRGVHPLFEPPVSGAWSCGQTRTPPDARNSFKFLEIRRLPCIITRVAPKTKMAQAVDVEAAAAQQVQRSGVSLLRLHTAVRPAVTQHASGYGMSPFRTDPSTPGHFRRRRLGPAGGLPSGTRRGLAVGEASAALGRPGHRDQPQAAAASRATGMPPTWPSRPRVRARAGALVAGAAFLMS
jgi:hypothetical protein